MRRNRNMGEPTEFDDLAEFAAYCDEREKRPAQTRKRERPVVQQIGEGPAPKVGPECHLCHDTRRLVPDVLKLPASTGHPHARMVPLCRTCIKQIEWDRAHRCISCGTHAEVKLMKGGGVCPTCVSKGAEAQQNLIALIQLRWVGVIRGD